MKNWFAPNASKNEKPTSGLDEKINHFTIMSNKSKYQPRDSVQVKVRADDESLKGQFANMIQISHNKEEFILDYMVIMGEQGIVVSRVIVTPGHFKRMFRAFEDNIRKYEANHGGIFEPEELIEPDASK